MRVLAVSPGPTFSVSDVYNGWIDGLRSCGVEVVEYPFADRLYHAQRFHVKKDGEYRQAFPFELAVLYALEPLGSWIYETQPDVVLFVSGFWIRHAPYDLIRKRGSKVVLLCTESPYEDDTQLAAAAHVDTVILNDPTNIDQFRDVTDAIYMPHGYRPDLHRPGPRTAGYESDLCIIGTGYRSRVEWLEQFPAEGLDLALLGNWASLEGHPLAAQVRAGELDECCDNTETVKWYQSTGGSLNLYRREANRPDLSAGWACGPREIELAAIGTFYLTEPRGENRELFPMIPTFDSPGDAAEKLRWYRSRPDQVANIVRAARAAVHPHTFAQHAAQFLEHLGRNT